MKNIFKKLPFYNITRSKGRSLGIIGLILLLSFSLFLTSVLSLSLKNGLESTKNRLGADMIILPEEDESVLESVIISGEPSFFYMEDSILEKIEDVEGIDKASPQLFMATLSADCCSMPIQIIGLDFETDFVVTPWLRESVDLPLEKDEVIVGSNIVLDPGGVLVFFERNLHIKGKLERSGMGFDNTVFMDLEDARRLAERSEDYGVETPENPENLVSSIMIDVKEGEDVGLVLRDINKIVVKEGAKAVRASSLIMNTQEQIESSTVYIHVLLGIIWGLSILVLFIVFPLFIRSRTSEFVAIRILGATKKDLSLLIFKESLYFGLIGSFLGTIIGVFISFLFRNTFENILDLPFLMPSSTTMTVLFFSCLLLCTFISILSSLISIVKINRREIALAEEE